MAVELIRPEIENIFYKTPLIQDGWQPFPNMSERHDLLARDGCVFDGSPGLEIRVDAESHHVTHEEAAALRRFGDPISGQILHKAIVMRRREAYSEIRTLGGSVHIPGVGPCASRQEYARQASFFIKGLHDAIHHDPSCRISHAVMGSRMHHKYIDSIGVLGTMCGWSDYIRLNASPYKLGDVTIIPSMYIGMDSPDIIFAIDSACALRFQGRVSLGRGGIDADVPETHDTYRFMLLSKENTRIAPGIPYHVRPGFRILVDGSRRDNVPLI